MKTKQLVAALILSSAFGVFGSATAQVAGSTTTGVTVSETNQLAMGWSVRKTILGKAVYDDAGVRIGKVTDLIIAPDRNVTYMIVGAGGFVGIGRHDVAVPVSQIKDKGGRLVMAGATKDTIKAMPVFNYSNDTAKRDQFIARAERDIGKARTKLAAMESTTAAAGSEAKAKLDQQTSELKIDLKTTEDKLAQMKMAGANRWKEFEGDVSSATARLRKWVETVTG